MFRAVRLYALAAIALAILTTVPVSAQTEGTTSDTPTTTTSDLPTLPIIEIPLYVGTTRADFPVFEGENINTAAEKFGVAHGLTPEDLQTLKAEVTQRLVSVADSVKQSLDKNAPLFEVPVGLENGSVVPLRLYEGDDLLSAVTKFAEVQNIPEDFVPHLFEEVKKRVVSGGADQNSNPENSESNQIVFDFPVTFDGETEHRVVLRRGDVVQDVVERMAVELSLDDDLKANFLESVVQRVKDAAQIADQAELASRAAAGKSPVYTIDVKRGEDTLPLRLYEGDVLEQAVHAFVQRHGIDNNVVPMLIERAMESIKQAAQIPPEPAVDENGKQALVTLAVSMDAPADVEGEERVEQGTEQEGYELTTENSTSAQTLQLPAISLWEGETPEEAAQKYCEQNGLDPEAVGPQLAEVLRQGVAKREAAVAEAAAKAKAEEGAEEVTAA